MNYFDLVNPKNKIDVSKSKQIDNLNLKVQQYVNYGRFDADSIRCYYYIISFFSEDYSVPIIMQISLKEIWYEIKNHIKMGESVSASGILHYDYNNNLDYIEIKEVTINNIKFTVYNICLNNINSDSMDNVKGSKKVKNKISVMVILFFIYMILMYIFSRLKDITAISNIMDKLFYITLVLFLLNIIIIGIWAYIKNKKVGKEAKVILEKNGFYYIEQSFLRCSQYVGGALQDIRYKEEIVER